jgi:tetratricopeptide (TPR) repeat protein
VADGQGRDFFISYTQVNRLWAEWIAVQLEGAGYTTVLQAWDFRPGRDFLHEMQQATKTAKRTIAVLSPAYFGSEFSEAEWRAAFVKDPTGERGLLVPVRVQECEPPGLLASRLYINLVDTDEGTAKRLLLEGVGELGARPTSTPFPGPAGGTARFPGYGPEVSNLPARNPSFSGRGELLEELYASMQTGSAAAVVATVALSGLGGVGKTQLALEFAHRFASDYDIAWWVPAEPPTSATSALATLARRLGVEELADQGEMMAGLFDRLRQRDRWLLIYDNVERPDRLAGMLPSGGGGHVLVTSRWSTWGHQATPLRVDVLARKESITFLAKRTGSDVRTMLDELAELLGDLPLALEEAAAYLEETRVAVYQYLELVRDRAQELLGLDQPPADEYGDQRRIATVWSLSLDRVHQEEPAVEALLSLCAFLASDIPRDLLSEQPLVLPEELAQVVGDPLAYNRMLAAVGRYSLAALTPTTISLHRLVAAVIRARLGRETERRWADLAVRLLREIFPNQTWDPSTWKACERLLPHAITVADHAQQLRVAGQAAGWLLERATNYLCYRGQYRQARPIAEQALAITEAMVGPADPEVGERCSELGRVLLYLEDLPQAEAVVQRAVGIGEASLDPGDPKLAVWRGNLGTILWKRGDLKGAKAQHEQALAIEKIRFGTNHRQVAIRHNNLGLVLHDLGNLSQAREHYEQAVAIGRAALRPDEPDLAVWHHNLGNLLVDLGDSTNAKAEFEQALKISEAALGPNHSTVAAAYAGFARVLNAIGDLEGAKAQLERALAILERAVGPDHPNAIVCRGNLGTVLWSLGDAEGARVQLERALEIRDAALGPDHPPTAFIREKLDIVLRALDVSSP